MTGVVLVVLAGLTGPAHADTPEPDPLVEVRTARGAIGPLGIARFEVTLDVDVPAFSFGPVATLDLPVGGAVTAATLVIGGTKHGLALALHSHVDEQFAALRDAPGHDEVRTWGARLDAATDAVSFELLGPGYASGTLTLTVDAPSCWNADTRAVLVPSSWAPLLAGVTPVHDAAEAAELDRACDAPVIIDRTWVRFPSRALAKQPSGESRIGITASAISAGNSTVARLEIALARELADVPRDLYTVLVVDESRSLTDNERDTQRELVAAYVRAAPRGRVQIVAYARNAQALLPRWMQATDAAATIDEALRKRPLRNGSNIERAVEVAASQLANVTGTRRVIVISDERLTYGTRANIERIASVVPASTTVHVVSLEGFDRGLVRDDDSDLAALVHPSEGIMLFANADDSDPIDAMPLVRPTSLDRVTVTGNGWNEVLASPRACPSDDPLTEGRSCVWSAVGARTAGPLTVTGYLWGHRVTRTVEADTKQATQLARILMNDPGLPTELLASIETAARAVNSTWSLAATWGPDGGYEGLDEPYGTMGFGALGTSSHDAIDGIGHGRPVPDLAPELVAQLGPAVRGCRPTQPVELAVELTIHEIADLRVRVQPADRGVATCIADAVWATPVSFESPRAHALVNVSI